MAGELKLSEVATPTAPAAGKDSLYMGNSTPSRLLRLDSAGNIWPVAEQLILTNTADYTLANTGAAEKALNGSTNGLVTLPPSMSYLMELHYTLTNTGTTSHTWAILFGGTATLTSIGYHALAETATSNALAALSAIYATAATALVVTPASVSATENVIITARGIIRVNAAGTLIPQIKPSAATTGVAKVLANSYIKLTPFGADVSASLGPWT